MSDPKTPDVQIAARSLRFSGRGRVARYAHTHRWARRLLWRFDLLPNVLGPFYRSES